MGCPRCKATGYQVYDRTDGHPLGVCGKCGGEWIIPQQGAEDMPLEMLTQAEPSIDELEDHIEAVRRADRRENAPLVARWLKLAAWIAAGLIAGFISYVWVAEYVRTEIMDSASTLETMGIAIVPAVMAHCFGKIIDLLFCGGRQI